MALKVPTETGIVLHSILLYSQLSLGLAVFSHFTVIKLPKDGHLSKTDNGHFKTVNGHTYAPSYGHTRTHDNMEPWALRATRHKNTSKRNVCAANDSK